MKQINDIFYNGIGDEKSDIIKKVTVDWDVHYNGLINIAKAIEPDFRIENHTEKALKLLLMYFTGNENFVMEMKKNGTNNASLSKGIMLIGGIGTGKSLLFKILKKYTGEILRVNSYQYHTSQIIIDNVNVSGVETLEVYNHNYGRPITCYIDDIASNNEKVKHFGTEINAIEQVLSIRYNIYSRYNKLTHVSSNKYPIEMVALYDERIVDRMKEMFNIIELDGKSFRI